MTRTPFSEHRLASAGPRGLLALLAAALLFVPLVACGGGGGGLGGLLVSDDEEVEIGTGVDEQIEQEFVIAKDGDAAATWARQMVEHMEPASKPFRDPEDFGGYKVELIADDELVNAFAAPGGFVYITTGLVLKAESCGEVAGVVGHELAHVTERHGVKQLEDALLVGAITELFVDDELAAGVTQLAFDILVGTQHSQAHESEADDVGLQISHDADYNPYGIVVFFQRLLALEREAGGTPDWLQFFSTHPATEDRVNAAIARIGELYPGLLESDPSYECQGTTLDFEAVRQHILDGKVEVRPETGQGAPEGEAEGEAEGEGESNGGEGG